jgi:uridine nucleosidase
LESTTFVEMHQALMTCPPNTAWLVTTGTLTNAALLFSTFPKLVDHIRGLSIMGGAVGSNFTDANLGRPFPNASGGMEARIGNHTPYAEFNIWCDPESARNIFINELLRKKTTLITLDLTHQVFATRSVQDLVLYGREEEGKSRKSTRLRTMFYELLTFFAKTYADVFGLTAGPPLHDPLAVAVLLAEAEDEETRISFDDKERERFMVDVELTNPELGRTRAKSVSEGVRIPRALDTTKFWRVLNGCLARADSQTGRVSHPS